LFHVYIITYGGLGVNTYFRYIPTILGIPMH
jgi:hypothetical protein